MDRRTRGLLRQLRQEQADARKQFAVAKARGDQKTIAFIAGQLSAFQQMIETVEVDELEPPDERRKAS